MSTIDHQSGYWEIPIIPEDQDKTCFVILFGTFKFKRMPIGLKVVTRISVCLVDKFRAGLADVSLFAYFYDLFLFQT